MTGSSFVTSAELLEAYGFKQPRTLINWTKRKVNPLPKPVMGGCGAGSYYRWLRSSIEEWEMKEYGEKIVSAR